MGLAMLGVIAKKELANHLAGFRFWAGALLAVVLATAATRLAARDYEIRRERFEARTANAAQTLRHVDVYSALHPLIVRPPQPLSILDQGFDSRLGTEVVLQLFEIPTDAAAANRGNEFLPSGPDIDLTTVVSLVLGLLALLLTCDALVGEREDGTLKATFAVPVERRTLLLGKLLGALAALVLPLAAIVAMAFSVLTLAVPEPIASTDWLRAGALLFAYLAYLLLALVGGLTISLFAKSSSSALRIALVLWFAVAVAVPRAAGALARDVTTTELSTRAESRKIAEITRRLDADLERAFTRSPLRRVPSGHTAVSFKSGERRAVHYRHGSASYYDDLAAYYRFEVRAGLAHAEQVFALREQARRDLRRNERRALFAASISPSFLLERLAEALTATSVAEHERFLAACRDQRIDLIEYIEREATLDSWAWFTSDTPDALVPWTRYLGLEPSEVGPDRVLGLLDRLSEPAIAARLRADRAKSRPLDLSHLPRFEAPPPSFSAAVSDATPFLLALGALGAVVSTFLVRGFREYPLA